MQHIPALTENFSRPQVTAVSLKQFSALRKGVPVLDVEASTTDLGHFSDRFAEDVDENLGQYMQACFKVNGVLVYLRRFRLTDDGTMTVFVDLPECVDQLRSPLSIARAALLGLELESARCTWVHTPSETLFWQQVDPHRLAARMS